jgi:cyclohexa-1,5-dienecarbonyl-CoA hydratase
MDTPRVSVAKLDDGQWWRVTIGGSTGNILDAAAMAALCQVMTAAQRDPVLKAIILEGEGDHFSFGASVQEHLPAGVESMLGAFSHLLLTVLDSAVVLLAAIRGRCLGGGLELVTLAHRVFASRDAKLGQPEISLGVFAPAASVLLPTRIGRANAEDLCLTGRIVGAAEAHALGLVDEVVDAQPAEAALVWARTHLASKSASSLRHAIRAIRFDLTNRLTTDLPAIERLYLDELMQTADAVEGLNAFLEKRTPQWMNR